LRKLGRRLKVSEAIAFEKQVRVAFYFNSSRACLQLGGLCMRTDQNQTRNIVLFAAPPVRWGFPNQLSSD
jgi:hypothetical protein